MDSGDSTLTGEQTSARNDPAGHQHPSEEPMLYCPVCDKSLVSLRCKLICERCGYFMSCADYY
jgi:hypothetical protein